MLKKVNQSSSLIWLEQIKNWPIHYLFVLLFIIFTIPLTLVILVLIPYAFKVINSAPTFLTWTEFLGEHVTRWLRPLIQDTPFQYGISLEFQKDWFPLIILMSAIFLGFFTFISEYLLKDLGEKLSFKLRKQVVDQYLSIHFKASNSLEPGLLASMVGEDIREIQNTFTRLIGGLIKDGLTALIFIAWLVILNTQLFVLLIAVLIPAGIVVRITGKKLKRLSREGLQFESELLGSTLERMKGWQTIQVHQALKYELNKFRLINDKLFHIWRRATRARSLGTPLVEWLGIIAGAFIIIVALRRISDGILTASILTSFLFTLALLSDKINRITMQLNTTRKGTEALRRIQEFLHHPFFFRSNIVEKKESVFNNSSNSDNDPFHKISFHNFIVQTDENNILTQKINLSLERGNILCIIGASGSGKSTFIKTLLGIEQLKEGEILIDDFKVSEKFLYENRNKICYIPQEPFIFNGSIFDNVIYPEKTLEVQLEQMEKVKEALDKALLTYDPLKEIHGLSGGEKQRLMFARVFYRQPKLVIIDEGTSALDTLSEQKIMSEFKSRAFSFITIMVAHRPAIQTYATQILDFNKIRFEKNEQHSTNLNIF